MRRLLLAALSTWAFAMVSGRNSTRSCDICWATGTGMSPDAFKEFELPYTSMAADMVRRHRRKFVGSYAFERVRKFLPMLVDTGVDFIESFEPNEAERNHDARGNR